MHRPTIQAPNTTYALRIARRLKATTLSGTLKDLIIQRVTAPSVHQYGINLLIDRTTDGLHDLVYENYHERVAVFRTAFVDMVTNTKTSLNSFEMATLQEVMFITTMIPRPKFHPTAEITCDLSMVSVITHNAQHILQPTWRDQYNGLRAHLTQLSALICVVVQDLERRAENNSSLCTQSVDFANRCLTNTFMTNSIFMKPWFDGRAGWQQVLLGLDVFLTPIYENHRLAPLPAEEIAPWNLCLFILNGKLAVSFAYLMAMTCLFDAWCPHNFNMVTWMTAHHICDVLDNYTVEKQMRVAALLFWLFNCDDLSRFPAAMHSDLVRIRARLIYIMTEKKSAIMRGETPPAPTPQGEHSDEEIDDIGDVFDTTFPGWRNDTTGPVMAATLRVAQTDPVLLIGPKAEELPTCPERIHDTMSSFGKMGDAIAFSHFPGLGADVDLFCRERLEEDPASNDFCNNALN